MKRTKAPPGSPGHCGGRRPVERKILIVCWLVCLIGLGLPALAQTVYIAPDVPTDPGPGLFLPWDVIEHVNGAPVYNNVLAIPGDPAIDALHKMDLVNNWLFSVEAPNDLGGAFLALPEDVVRWAGGVMTPFFDGSCVSPTIPPGSNVNAALMVPDDFGDIVVVFDVPTETAGSLTLPSGWAQYSRTGPGPCDWSYIGNFDTKFSSTAYFPDGARITGLATINSDQVLVAFDVPVDLSPSSGPPMYLPGQIALLDFALGSWSMFEDMEGLGWPVSSRVNALSCQANPGSFNSLAGQQILLGKIGTDVTIICPNGCSSGAEVGGIYEGSLTNLHATGLYDHVQVDCAASCPGSNNLVPVGGDRYFLVVPNNRKSEGSYGLDFISGSNNERPQPPAASDRCVELQVITTCP